VAGEKSRSAVTSQLVADRAIDWIKRRSTATRPFFLFLHFFDVHYDYNPPAPYSTMFDAGYHGPANGSVELVRSGAPARDVDHIVALYDGEIAWVDANIGRILAQLKTMGIDENTIVVVTADHGEEFLDHGSSGHYKTLYDEVLRVPLIIRYPGHVAAGRRVGGQVRLMDVGPTLFALADLPRKKSHEATSARNLSCFTKLTAKSGRVPSLPAFGDLKGEMASLRTVDAKLIRNLRTNREEFYDLSRDPLERHNVDAHDAKAAGMRETLNRWRSSASGSGHDEVELDDEEKADLKSLGYMQ